MNWPHDIFGQIAAMVTYQQSLRYHDIVSPWVRDNVVYATNGSILAWAKHEAKDCGEKVPNVEDLLKLGENSEFVGPVAYDQKAEHGPCSTCGSLFGWQPEIITLEHGFARQDFHVRYLHLLHQHGAELWLNAVPGKMAKFLIAGDPVVDGFLMPIGVPQ